MEGRMRNEKPVLPPQQIQRSQWAEARLMIGKCEMFALIFPLTLWLTAAFNLNLHSPCWRPNGASCIEDQ